ncbi:universal stress protein [Natrialbaceae archaeon A-gly3]
MYDTILVPVDGSPGSEGAIANALAFARETDATVHALSVIETLEELEEFDPDQRVAVRRASEKRAEEATGEVAAAADEVGVEVVRNVREGRPDRTILEYAEEVGADLIVMGTRGLTAAQSIRLGSTTERVIARAEVPVLSVRLSDPEGPPAVTDVSIDRVLLPTDGSGAAERAADRALEFAESVGATVHVVYVLDRSIYDLEDAPKSIIGMLREGGQSAIEAVALEAEDRGLSVTTDLLRGVPEMEVLEYAEGVDADLIAMGTRGRGGGSDRVLGSTTSRVVRRSERPVLTTK